MSEEKEMQEKDEGMPVKQELFLEAGVHIGTKIRTNDMRKYIFKRRDDGLFILDLRQSADRIMEAAKIVSDYKPEEVTVVASRVYSSNPASKFARLTGVNAIKGRYVPGTMTNIQYAKFIEPKLVIVCDPKGERQAINEGKKTGAKVIAFCDTDNETKNIDLIVPVNNKGKRSLALIFYILSRELMMTQGTIKSYDEFKYDINYFEQYIEEKEEKETPEAAKQEEPAPKEEKADQKPKEAPKDEKKEEKPAEKKEEKSEEAPKEKEEKPAEKPKEEKPKKPEKPKDKEVEEKKPEEKKEEKSS